MFAGQFNREQNGLVEMATLYQNGDELEVSIFVSYSDDMEIIKDANIKTKMYFRFDIIMNLLQRGFV